jgi:hypothetical protein
MARQCFSEKRLALAAMVGVGGVEIIDPLLDGIMDHGRGFFFINGFGGVKDIRCLVCPVLQRKSHAAESQGRQFTIGLSQLSIQHGLPSVHFSYQLFVISWFPSENSPFPQSLCQSAGFLV